MGEKVTAKQKEARDSLPEELRPLYDELVADYKFATFKRHGRGYVAYMVLADLVRVGWRPPVVSPPEQGREGTPS